MKLTPRRALNWFISPALLLWLLPALMLLVAVGTIAQKYVGLYAAEKTYFSSFVIWVGGFIPLPGGYTLLGIFSLSLLLKFLLKSEWRRGRAGINLAHFGVVLLMAGGLVSSLLAEDGAMTIGEGETARQVHDYYQRDLMLVTGDTLLQALSVAGIHAGRQVAFKDVPVTLEVRASCNNCSITRRVSADAALRGMAKGMVLEAINPEKNNEENTGGLTFRLRGAGEEADGIYILFENGPATTFEVNGKTYELAYGKSQRSLPFTVELKDFTRTNYPGTETASAFHSDIIIHDGALSWPARIEMNQPLRYRGYTFYQSAFLEQDGKQWSVLAVSHDAGQFIPYLGTLVLGLGLLLHLFIRRSGMTP